MASGVSILISNIEGDAKIDLVRPTALHGITSSRYRASLYMLKLSNRKCYCYRISTGLIWFYLQHVHHQALLEVKPSGEFTLSQKEHHQQD